jgi:hypothetical protein
LSTYLADRRSDLSFGDVCETDFLYDVFVRSDTRGLRREEAPAKFAQARWQINEPVPYFISALERREQETYVLAHGWHRRAICISDDCFILSALGRNGGSPDGRILFAPVMPATQEDLAGFEEYPTYGRYPLIADDVFVENSIIELRRCFMVDARDVAAALPDFVVLSTSDSVRVGLANRWSAYAARRGPFVVEDNVEKLAELLIEYGIEAADAESLGNALAAAAAAGWTYEGGGLEGAGIAADEHHPPGPALEELERLLAQLADLTDVARHALDHVRAQLA